MRKGAVVLGALLVFLFALRPVYDFDVWFDLRMGEYILSTHTVPHRLSFLWTASTFQAPYAANDEWGFSVLAHTLWQAWGTDGLSYYVAVMLLIMCGLGVLAARRRGASWPAIAIATLLAYQLMVSRLMPRPQLITDAFLAAFVLLADVLPPKRYWIFPLLMVAWCNFHAGCIIGVVYLGVLVFADALQGLMLRLRAAWPVPLVLAAAACLLAMPASPAGFGLLGYLYSHFFVRSLDVAAVEEWRFIGLHSWIYNTVVGIELLGLGVLGWQRRARWQDVCVVAAFAPYGMLHSRNVAELAVATGPILAVALDALLSPLYRLRVPAGVRQVLVLGGLSAWAIWLGAHRLPLHQSADAYPEKAIAWLRSHRLPSQLYNSYHLGGYLAWRGYPDYLPFIHGLTPTYPESLFEDNLKICVGGPAGRAVLERYGVQEMMVGYSLAPDDVTGQTLKWLEKDPAWKLVYWDDTALIYTRRTPAFDGLAAYERVVPGAPEDWHLTDPQALEELQRAVRDAPSVLACCWLGDALKLAGDAAGAEQQYRAAVSLDPQSSLPHVRLGELLGGQDRSEEAATHLKLAWGFAPDVTVAYNLAVLESRLGRDWEAGHWVRAARRLDPGFAPARNLQQILHVWDVGW